MKKLADKVNRSGSDGVWGRTVVRHMTEDKNYEAALFYKYGWVNKLIKNAFAFEYKGKDEDYYYTNESRGVQSGAGFMDLFDDAGGFLGMDLDTKIVKYEYNGKNYRLQFWKGSYGFGNAYGGEIGLYYNTDGGEWYKTVQGKDQIRTEQYIKDRNGKVLIHNDTADYAKNWDHYWNLAIRTSRGYSKEMLVQESYITFHNKAERDAVIEGLEKTKGILYEPYDSNQIKVVF